MSCGAGRGSLARVEHNDLVAMTYKALNAMTDEQLEEAYDKTAVNTGVGLAWWRDEIGRRAYQRARAVSAGAVLQ